jgi:hypothetical protein
MQEVLTGRILGPNLMILQTFLGNVKFLQYLALGDPFPFQAAQCVPKRLHFESLRCSRRCKVSGLILVVKPQLPGPASTRVLGRSV